MSMPSKSSADIAPEPPVYPPSMTMTPSTSPAITNPPPYPPANSNSNPNPNLSGVSIASQPTSSEQLPSTTHTATAPQSKRPNLSDPSSSQSNSNSLTHRSCVTCRRRKVRCNKCEPCSNCVKAGIDCIFPGPGRAPRKPQRRPIDVDVLTRLRKLEGVVESLGGTEAIEKLIAARLAESSPVDNNVASPSRTFSAENDARNQSVASGASNEAGGNNTPPESYEGVGRLVINDSKSAYISDRFWYSISEQIEEVEEIFESPSEEDIVEPPSHNNKSSPSSSSQNHDAFLFGYSSVAKNLRGYHPTPTQAFILWKTYEQNVAPLLTIVHKLAARNLIINAATDQDTLLDKSNEALMFAIYLAAVISMPPEQCLADLGEDRDAAITRLRFATEQALARANLLNSSNINLLQAAVLFLSSAHRLNSGKFVWSMSALVLRLATGLGLHRDGTNFGLSPFETEMRRRLWWHIFILDVRTAEAHGTDAMIYDHMYDTKMPLHINDDDISPESTTFPRERASFTDMTFTLIRCHICQNYRKLVDVPMEKQVMQPIFEQHKKSVEQLHNTLNEKFVQYCDMQEPFQWATATMARFVVSKLWLLVHHPIIKNNLTSLSPEDRNRILLTSIEVIEFTRLLETSETTRCWGWLFGAFVQWHAIAFVLAELCVRPWCPGVDRAWLAIDSTFHDWERRSAEKKGLLWRPLRKLYNKAQAIRLRRFEVPPTSCSTMQPLAVTSNQSRPSGHFQQQQQEQQQRQYQEQTAMSNASHFYSEADSSQRSSPGQVSRASDRELSGSTIFDQTSASSRTNTISHSTPELQLDLSKNMPDIMNDLIPVIAMAFSDGANQSNTAYSSNVADAPNVITGMEYGMNAAYIPNSTVQINPNDSLWISDAPNNTFGMPVDWQQLDNVMRDFQQEFEQVAEQNPSDAHIPFM